MNINLFIPSGASSSIQNCFPQNQNGNITEHTRQRLIQQVQINHMMKRAQNQNTVNQVIGSHVITNYPQNSLYLTNQNLMNPVIINYQQDLKRNSFQQTSMQNLQALDINNLITNPLFNQNNIQDDKSLLQQVIMLKEKQQQLMQCLNTKKINAIPAPLPTQIQQHQSSPNNNHLASNINGSFSNSVILRQQKEIRKINAKIAHLEKLKNDILQKNNPACLKPTFNKDIPTNSKPTQFREDAPEPELHSLTEKLFAKSNLFSPSIFMDSPNSDEQMLTTSLVSENKQETLVQPIVTPNTPTQPLLIPIRKDSQSVVIKIKQEPIENGYWCSSMKGLSDPSESPSPKTIHPFKQEITDKLDASSKIYKQSSYTNLNSNIAHLRSSLLSPRQRNLISQTQKPYSGNSNYTKGENLEKTETVLVFSADRKRTSRSAFQFETPRSQASKTDRIQSKKTPQNDIMMLRNPDFTKDSSPDDAKTKASPDKETDEKPQPIRLTLKKSELQCSETNENKSLCDNVVCHSKANEQVLTEPKNLDKCNSKLFDLSTTQSLISPDKNQQSDGNNYIEHNDKDVINCFSLSQPKSPNMKIKQSELTSTDNSESNLEYQVNGKYKRSNQGLSTQEMVFQRSANKFSVPSSLVRLENGTGTTERLQNDKKQSEQTVNEEKLHVLENHSENLNPKRKEKKNHEETKEPESPETVKPVKIDEDKGSRFRKPRLCKEIAMKRISSVTDDSTDEEDIERLDTDFIPHTKTRDCIVDRPTKFNEKNVGKRTVGDQSDYEETGKIPKLIKLNAINKTIENEKHNSKFDKKLVNNSNASLPKTNFITVSEYDKEKYFCTLCQSKCEEFDILEEHCNKIHLTSSNGDVIDIDDHTTDERRGMKNFTIVEKYMTQYKCSLCFQSFMYLVNYKQHCQLKHLLLSIPESNTTTKYTIAFQCKSCPKFFLYKISFEKHFKECHAKSLSCKFCLAKLKNMDKLADHINICPKYIKYRRERDIVDRKELCGIKKRSTNPKEDSYTFLCPACCSIITPYSACLEHMKLHQITSVNSPGPILVKLNVNDCTKPKFQCNFCTVMRNDEKDLLRHIKTIHIVHKKPDHGTFICEYCDLVSSEKGTLFRHYNQKHKIRLEYLCEYCNRNFDSNALLSNHIKHSHALSRFSKVTMRLPYHVDNTYTEIRSDETMETESHLHESNLVILKENKTDQVEQNQKRNSDETHSVFEDVSGVLCTPDLEINNASSFIKADDLRSSPPSDVVENYRSPKKSDICNNDQLNFPCLGQVIHSSTSFETSEPSSSLGNVTIINWDKSDI